MHFVFIHFQKNAKLIKINLFQATLFLKMRYHMIHKPYVFDNFDIFKHVPVKIGKNFLDNSILWEVYSNLNTKVIVIQKLC